MTRSGGFKETTSPGVFIAFIPNKNRTGTSSSSSSSSSVYKSHWVFYEIQTSVWFFLHCSPGRPEPHRSVSTTGSSTGPYQNQSWTFKRSVSPLWCEILLYKHKKKSRRFCCRPGRGWAELGPNSRFRFYLTAKNSSVSQMIIKGSAAGTDQPGPNGCGAQQNLKENLWHFEQGRFWCH